MRPVALLQHEATPSPRVLCKHLDSLGVPWRLLQGTAESGARPHAQDYSGIVVPGGNPCIPETSAAMAAGLDVLRDAIAHDVPVLALGAGAQMLALAMNARVWRAPCPQIGWAPVWVTRAAQRDMGLCAQTLFFHWQRDTFNLPPGAVRTQYGELCLNQGFRRGRHWAFQGLLEVTAQNVQDWCVQGRTELRKAHGPAVQSAAQMQEDLPLRIAQLHATGRQICEAWARQLDRPPKAAVNPGPAAGIQPSAAITSAGACTSSISTPSPAIGNSSLLLGCKNVMS